MTDIEWVEESDWGKVAAFQLARFVKHNAALEGQVFKDGQSGSPRVELWASSHSLKYLKDSGFTLYVEAKPAVEMPTVDGHYADRDGDVWQLTDSQWWSSDQVFTQSVVATYAPFTRLEPVAETAKKIIDRIGTMRHLGEVSTLGQVQEILRKEFGVTK